MCYAPEEGGVSDTVRRKFEAQVSSVPGVVLGRLDVEQQQELATNLQLAEIPTVFAIHDKKVVNKISGNLNDTEIEGFIANCAHLARLASGERRVASAVDTRACVPIFLLCAHMHVLVLAPNCASCAHTCMDFGGCLCLASGENARCRRRRCPARTKPIAALVSTRAKRDRERARERDRERERERERYRYIYIYIERER